ncbi:hypothetical protein XENOCAPTIV_011692 [Xenoophorus captivus]|uniref:Uncharacterized protein n=1 Tax=Xenoophorus captivus TaxID=1517983 RepID=A0ABV0RKI9_9TELE
MSGAGSFCVSRFILGGCLVGPGPPGCLASGGGWCALGSSESLGPLPDYHNSPFPGAPGWGLRGLWISVAPHTHNCIFYRNFMCTSMLTHTFRGVWIQVFYKYTDISSFLLSFCRCRSRLRVLSCMRFIILSIPYSCLLSLLMMFDVSVHILNHCKINLPTGIK